MQEVFSFVSQRPYTPSVEGLYMPSSWKKEKENILNLWENVRGLVIDGMEGEGKTSFMNYILLSLQEGREGSEKYVIQDITLTPISNLPSQIQRDQAGNNLCCVYVIDDITEFQSINNPPSIKALRHIIETSPQSAKYIIVGNNEFEHNLLTYHVMVGDILSQEDRREILKKIIDRYGVKVRNEDDILKLLEAIRGYKFLEKELIELIKEGKNVLDVSDAEIILNNYYKRYFGNFHLSVYFPPEIEDDLVISGYFDLSLRYMITTIEDEQDSPFFFLYGEQGTGKTTLSKLLAKRLNIPLIVIKGSELENKYVGETVNRLKEIFKYAYTLVQDFGRTIILFDEITGLLSERVWYKQDQVEYFLSVSEELKKKGCIVIGTTNKPWEMGRVLSRFDSRIYIPLPTTILPQIVEYYAHKTGINKEEINNILEQLEKDKLSIRDIERIAQLIHRGSRMGVPIFSSSTGIENFTYENNLLPVDWKKIREEIGDDLSLFS